MLKFVATFALSSSAVWGCDVILENDDTGRPLYLYLNETGENNRGAPIFFGRNFGHTFTLTRGMYEKRKYLIFKEKKYDQMMLFPNTTVTAPETALDKRYGYTTTFPIGTCFPDGARFTFNSKIFNPNPGYLHVPKTSTEVNCLPPHHTDHTGTLRATPSIVETDGISEKVSNAGTFISCLRDGHSKVASNGDKFAGYALTNNGCMGYTGNTKLKSDPNGHFLACVLPKPKARESTTHTTTAHPATTVQATTEKKGGLLGRPPTTVAPPQQADAEEATTAPGVAAAQPSTAAGVEKKGKACCMIRKCYKAE